MWIWVLWNSLHLGNISITQCVEDILFICRRADWFPRARSSTTMSWINKTHCISTLLWDCGHSFSAHQACCVDLHMLVLLWAYCCLEITGKCATLCRVVRRRSLGKLVNLELRIILQYLLNSSFHFSPSDTEVWTEYQIFYFHWDKLRHIHP